jgi:hypothetical protein
MMKACPATEGSVEGMKACPATEGSVEAMKIEMQVDLCGVWRIICSLYFNFLDRCGGSLSVSCIFATFRRINP